MLSKGRATVAKRAKVDTAIVLLCDVCKQKKKDHWSGYIEMLEQMLPRGVLVNEKQIEMASWGDVVEYEKFAESHGSIPALVGIRAGKTYTALFLEKSYYFNEREIIYAIERQEASIIKKLGKSLRTIDCPVCFKSHHVSKDIIDLAIKTHEMQQGLLIKSVAAILEQRQEERWEEQAIAKTANKQTFYCAYFDLPSPYTLWPKIATLRANRLELYNFLVESIDEQHPDHEHLFQSRSEQGAITGAGRWYTGKIRKGNSTTVFKLSQEMETHALFEYVRPYLSEKSYHFVGMSGWGWHFRYDKQEIEHVVVWVRLVPPVNDYDGGILILIPIDNPLLPTELRWLTNIALESS